jgi:3-oxoacyl-[acyl-carrier protein] reductase
MLAGRTAFVSAATSGLGLAVALGLGEAGATVVVCGRDESRLGRAVDRLGSAGDAGTFGIVADVSSAAGAIAFIDEAVDCAGAPDILVLNGAGPPTGLARATPPETFEHAFAQVALPAIAMCHRVIEGMCDRGWGRILAITSSTVRQPIARLTPSTVSRAGLTGYLKSLATEVAGNGVTVNSVQPGLHETERVRAVYGEDLHNEVHRIPAGALGRTEDFGRIAALLCSDYARFVTGIGMLIDGGANAALF